ncbi:MAG: hypothetical protein SGILL_004981, partial [Bacillariaceae sp.]
MPHMKLMQAKLAVVAWAVFLPFISGFLPTIYDPSSRRLSTDLSRQLKIKLSGDESSTVIPSDIVTGATSETQSKDLYQRTNVTLTFPSLFELMDLRPGECVASEPFICSGCDDGENRQHMFRVKLYPRGGGHRSDTASSNDGFGMAYKVTSPLRSQPEERVGVYLQYLGKQQNSNDRPDSVATVDATFALRLKGRQRNTRKFDVEWRAGMRFVPSAKDSNLKQGLANDFGAHLMQTSLLKSFLGVSDDDMEDSTPLTAEVEVTIHNTALETQFQLKEETNDNIKSSNLDATSVLASLGKDIRRVEGKGTNIHNPENVRVGKIVVPILSRLNQRPKMFEKGAYPGVEYRILRILKDGEERFTSCPGADYELKPIYPLVAQLERSWPVSVNERDLP